MPTKELHRWVGDVERFMSLHWRREPVILDGAPTPPMTLDDVDAALAGGLLRTPYVEMVRAEAGVPASSYTESREVLFSKASGFAVGDGIVGLLADGATLLLRNTEQWHRPTAELVARLAEETERRVEAFFFVTPPGGRGLTVHRDDADVLLLQVAGSKAWSVRSAPDDADWTIGPVLHNPGTVLLDATVGEGQVLYIPRGHAHSAVGSQGLSVHLSLTIREVGGPHLERALPRVLLEGLRLPVRPLDEVGLLDTAEAVLAAARQRLQSLTAHELVQRARAAQRVQKLNTGDTGSVVRFADELAGLSPVPATGLAPREHSMARGV
jgi:hypothetical protein